MSGFIQILNILSLMGLNEALSDLLRFSLMEFIRVALHDSQLRIILLYHPVS